MKSHASDDSEERWVRFKLPSAEAAIELEAMLAALDLPGWRWTEIGPIRSEGRGNRVVLTTRWRPRQYGSGVPWGWDALMENLEIQARAATTATG